MERTDHNLVAVIMAGGVGTRFWPLSTEDRPKQFIRLFDERSLLQKSYDRIAGIVPDDRILVLTNDRFTHLPRRAHGAEAVRQPGDGCLEGGPSDRTGGPVSADPALGGPGGP